MTNAIMGVSGIANVDLADRCNRKLQCAFVMVLKADESLDGFPYHLGYAAFLRRKDSNPQRSDDASVKYNAAFKWTQEMDSNHRLSAYEADELPLLYPAARQTDENERGTLPALPLSYLPLWPGGLDSNQQHGVPKTEVTALCNAVRRLPVSRSAFTIYTICTPLSTSFF